MPGVIARPSSGSFAFQIWCRIFGTCRRPVPAAYAMNGDRKVFPRLRPRRALDCSALRGKRTAARHQAPWPPELSLCIPLPSAPFCTQPATKTFSGRRCVRGCSGQARLFCVIVPPPPVGLAGCGGGAHGRWGPVRARRSGTRRARRGAFPQSSTTSFSVTLFFVFFFFCFFFVFFFPNS